MLDAVQPKPKSRRGGARSGAGQPPARYEPPEARVDYEEARARNEAAKASLNELEFAKESGAWVELSAVEQASATAMAGFVQGLRGLSDALERQGLDPRYCQMVDEAVSEALADIGREMKRLHDQAAANA